MWNRWNDIPAPLSTRFCDRGLQAWGEAASDHLIPTSAGDERDSMHGIYTTTWRRGSHVHDINQHTALAHISVLDMNSLQRKHFTRHGMHLHTRGNWQLARLIVEAFGGRLRLLLTSALPSHRAAATAAATVTATVSAAVTAPVTATTVTAATVTVAVTTAASATVTVAVTATAAATITVTATANRLYSVDSRAPDADYIL
ncbi:hypothetical protein J6590_070143 [Homalodisca vitripennis]|nr:hypothetical protein J6590_070143 [Homalodisca vitripennis]